jgi:hypothetical protein
MSSARTKVDSGRLRYYINSAFNQAGLAVSERYCLPLSGRFRLVPRAQAESGFWRKQEDE